MHNLAHAVRALRRSPAFTLAAVATLALGIGANTAVFSVADAVVLRPLPYRDAGRLVMVWDQLLKLGLDQFPPVLSNYYDYRGQNRVFEDIAAFSYSDANLEGSADAAPERLEAMTVSANWTAVLGAHPALGEAFAPEQNEPGRGDAVILSHGLWRRRFGADPAILGQTIRLSGQSYRVQGVMPAGFGFTIRSVGAPDVWMPMAMPRSTARQSGSVFLIARLKAQISLESAQANLDTIAAGIEAAYHPYNGPHGEQSGYRVALMPLRTQLYGGLRSGVLLLAGAVVLVLLIACANVTNLLLARGEERQRDLSIRAALGATRRQLLAGLACESLLLALAGAAAGVLLARAAIAALPALGGLPGHARISMDLRVLGFTLLVSLATGLSVGLTPALRGLRGELSLGGGRTVVGGVRGRFPRVLVAGEAALGVTLLVGAGLLIGSLARLERVDPGFDARNVLTMRVSLPNARYGDDASRIGFYDRLTAGLSKLPGVESAALASLLPLAGGGMGGDPFSIEGRPYDASGRVPQVARQYRIGSEYFRAMRIALRQGRPIEARDSSSAPKVAVINETMARGFWPAGDAIGQRVVMGAPRPGVQWLSIVGVVADVRNSGLRTDPIPQIYTPYAQGAASSMFVVLRTPGEAMALALTARREIAAVDAGQAAYDVRTMTQRLEGSLGRDRFQTLLLGIFSLTALALSAIGIYGVLAYSVSRRVPEIGLRMALGAQPADVMRWVFVRGMSPAIAGLAAGLAGALGVTRLLRNLLFGVSPFDPWTFGAVAALFAVVALLACWIPARRAMCVDPMRALRWE